MKQYRTLNLLCVLTRTKDLLYFSIGYKDNFEISIDINVSVDDKVKLLGLYLNKNLMFRSHEDNVCCLSSAVFVLRNIILFNTKILTCAYFALIYSFLYYAGVIWRSETVHSEVLFSYNKRAIQVIAVIKKNEILLHFHFSKISIS